MLYVIMKIAQKTSLYAVDTNSNTKGKLFSNILSWLSVCRPIIFNRCVKHLTAKG